MLRSIPVPRSQYNSPQVEQELRCPFYAAGVIVEEEAAECADDFMEVYPSKPRRLPDCSHHCCRAQETIGELTSNDTPDISLNTASAA